MSDNFTINLCFSNHFSRQSQSHFSYEILFHLPFVPHLILRHIISADTLSSDVQPWFSEQMDMYNNAANNNSLLLRTHNAEENNQLHFTEGLAWYYDTCYGARKFPLISQYTSYVVNLYVSRRALVILANSLDIAS